MENPAAPKTEEKREEVYLEWVSPSRLFKKRDREYFTNIAAIVFLLSIILVFAREFVLIATVLSVVFLIYVLSTVAPEEVKHKITNLGIESAGQFYRWEQLFEFWFEAQWGQTLLVLRPLLGPRVIILLGGQDRNMVREYIAKHIPFRDQPQRTWVDNAARWITEKIPLEKPTA
ncbi:hypothetical protein HY031_02820 [Candidatus Gottesmanbacteria bacterium]|nr:hypothetical protein [Candidatus Gottesmanbacteria bacterium]